MTSASNVAGALAVICLTDVTGDWQVAIGDCGCAHAGRPEGSPLSDDPVHTGEGGELMIPVHPPAAATKAATKVSGAILVVLPLAIIVTSTNF